MARLKLSWLINYGTKYEVVNQCEIEILDRRYFPFQIDHCCLNRASWGQRDMLADAGMGILSIRVVYWHYSVLQRKLSNKKNGE